MKKLLLIIFSFLFFISVVDAYEFKNKENEASVNSMITDIYDVKNQYEDLIGNSSNTENIYKSSNVSYWWPVGSSDTTEKNGVLYATGDPVSTSITKYFDSNHLGIDIDSNNNSSGEVNVIAVNAGEVIYPTSEELINYSDNGNASDGNGYGNYVTLKHSDGTYTIYAHLSKGSITVKSGDVVEQGQVIGKMGNSGESEKVHLHFEVRVGEDSVKNRVDPLKYISISNTRPNSSSSFSLITTTLTKYEFVARMSDYYERMSDGKSKNGFNENFLKNAEEIYDASISSGINPELVVVTAGTEQSWTLSSACQYTNNYWGLGISNGNGCNSGQKFSSMSEGIKAYAELINKYSDYGSMANMIIDTYNSRLSAGCDSSGHDLPGTLVGMQSIYSSIGKYRYNPGTSGLGGCYYLNIMYGAGYCDSIATCSDDYNSCSTESQTTVCEQNDYTAYQVKTKLKMRYDIFGL